MSAAAVSPDLLATIVAAARSAVAEREKRCPIERLAEGRTHQPRGEAFTQAIAAGEPPRIIAECKRRSPSKGILRRHYSVADHARSYAAAGAAAISVLTEPTFFDGDLAHLATVRAAVDTPLLRKDFIVTEYQVVEAAAAGADAILLIAGALDSAALGRVRLAAAGLGLAALVEVHNRAELDAAVAAGAEIIGVNSRDLRTLTVDLAVTTELAEAIPRDVVAVAESGITSGDDIRRLRGLGYDAFLVGERLITRADPGAALEALRTA